MLKRLYVEIIKKHFLENRQMLFISGPRQVGKTTTSFAIKSKTKPIHYFNWDNIEQKEMILKGPNEIAKISKIDEFSKNTPYIIFDEIHKFSKWKDFLKGFYDTFPNQAHIIVTGSARLDYFKKGGDSLMGRYFPLRLHPLSIAEITTPFLNKNEIRKKPSKIPEKKFNNLLKYGGYPDPFIKANRRFYNKWIHLRDSQLFKEDLRDLSRIQEVVQLELLTELIRRQATQLCTYDSLAKKVRVSSHTIRHWMAALEALYYCFSIRPFSKNISRSLLKEPKYYLWDWSLCDDEGAKAENFVASHLFKAVHFWTDYGFGNYELYFLRDKNKREVDFLITKDDQPFILIEVKKNNDHLSPSLEHFQKQLQAKYVFQVVLDAPYVNQNCFIGTKPLVVPAKTLLSQLI